MNNSSNAVDLREFLKKFINNNKKKLYGVGRKNTKINQEGKPVIDRQDPWFYDEWDGENSGK